MKDVAVSKSVTPEIMAATTENFDYRDLNALADNLILDLRDRAVALVGGCDSYEERDEKTYAVMSSGQVQVDAEDYDRVRSKLTPSSSEAQMLAMEEYANNNGK